MKKVFTRLTSMTAQGLIIACALFLLPNLVLAQVTGDYRTNRAAVTWSTAAHWDVYSGATWSAAGSAPTATTTVYIQAGHTATLTANGSCKDLNISTGTTDAATGGDGKVALVANTLELNGKINCYFGLVSPAGSLGAVASTTVPAAPITITAASAGKLSVVGATRTITGAWGIAATGATTLFPIEFNMTDNTQKATIASGGIKAQSWDIKVGIVSTTVRLHADANSATGGNGNFTIRTGATLESSVTGQAIVTQRAANAGGTFTLETGANLILTGVAPLLDMTTVVLDGTVEYKSTATQSFLNTTATGVTPAGVSPATYSYKNVTLSTGNPRALVANTTITGTLTLNNNALTMGANTLTLGGNSISRVGGYIDASDANAKIVFTNTAALTIPASTFLNDNIANLTMNGAANVNLSGPLKVSGILDLIAGNLSVGANTLTLAGTVSRTAGTITANNTGGATLAFTNPASVTLPAAYLSGGLYNMIVNGGGVVLGGSFTLNNQLTLTAGNLTLGSSTLTGNATLSPSITGGSATSYIIADGAGKLTMPHLAGALQTYPVGTASSYDPMTAQPTDATNISVSLKSAFDNAVGTPAKVAAKQWDISSSAPSSTILTLTPSNPVTTTTPKMGHYTAGAWEELAASRSGDTWTATTTSFSPFGAGEVGGFATVLSVELSNFKAKSSQKSNFLSWTTASETNNAYFDVQRATNGTDFQSIGQVKGNGTTTAESNYTYEDATPSVGTTYYRLRQVDVDGKETISKAISVVSQKGALATFYPSVTKGELTIDVPNNAPTTVIISNVMGQAVFTQTDMTSTNLLNISHLSAGTYFVTLKQKGIQITSKLVKQ
jgi:hypothetical protein